MMSSFDFSKPTTVTVTGLEGSPPGASASDCGKLVMPSSTGYVSQKRMSPPTDAVMRIDRSSFGTMICDITPTVNCVDGELEHAAKAPNASESKKGVRMVRMESVQYRSPIRPPEACPERVFDPTAEERNTPQRRLPRRRPTHR